MKTHTTGFRVGRPPWWSLVPIIQTFPYMTSIISHISRSFSRVFARAIYICNLYSHSTTLHNGITALKVTHVIKRFVVLFAWFMHVCMRKRMCLCVCKYLQICMCMCVCVCVCLPQFGLKKEPKSIPITPVRWRRCWWALCPGSALDQTPTLQLVLINMRKA